MADFKRQHSKTGKWLWRIALVGLLGTSVGWGILHVGRLESAVPTVEGSVYFGTVTRGTMLREVSGRGPLVPIRVTVVTSQVAGQVVEVRFAPGVQVEKGTALIVMKNVTLERNLVDAKRALKSAEAERDRFKLLLEQQELDLRAQTAQARAVFEDTKGEADLKAVLAAKGLISERENRLLQMRADRSWALLELQMARVENSQKTKEIQLQERDAAVARATNDVADRERELESLTIRATTDGILQELGPSLTERWDVGQGIALGARVAKITDPQNLKAVIEVSDVQAREVTQGQKVIIDTRSAEISGRVTRVDPAVKGGQVAVDVELLEELPAGARPDLEVYGKVEIERLDDVLQLSPRPGMATPNSTVELFRVAPDGQSADRVSVRLGRGSLNVIEILEGLSERDRVIVSDSKRYDAANRVRLPLP